jgi:hypothetical protein
MCVLGARHVNAKYGSVCWWCIKLAVMDHHLDAVISDVVAGKGGLEGLEGVLGQGLATGVDVSVHFAAKLLGLGVEGGSAGDENGIGIVVSGDDGLLVHGCKENAHKMLAKLQRIFF